MNKSSSPLSWRSSKERLEFIDSNGTIESFTILRSAPEGFEEQVPYVIAVIKLENGKKVTSQIADSKKIGIGMKVEPCIRRVYAGGDYGIINYGVKFKVSR